MKNTVCDYKPNSNQPCDDCPRLITALYRCGLLQEGAREDASQGPESIEPSPIKSLLDQLPH